MHRTNRINLGASNSYLICQEGRCILIDAGTSHKEGKIISDIKMAGIRPEQVELIIVTHVHYDHVGSLRAIKGICGCPVAVHQAEADILKAGKVVLPNGTGFVGKIIINSGQRAMVHYPGFFSYEPVEPEIIISGEMDLDDFGIQGKMLPTPGHTIGSLSVILPDGDAFVGDLAINYLPLGMGPIFPPFADDVNLLLGSWKRLLDLGITRMFPGHGRPFSALMIRAKYDGLMKI